MASEKKSTNKTTEKKAKLTVPLIALDGSVKNEMTLPAEIFGVEVSKTTLTNYIRVYTQNQRQGTHKAQTRGEVTATTKKLYRQKGTGGARHGSKRAPIFVGGGVTFGPQPRDYGLKMNKKQKVTALFSALTVKNEDNSVMGMAQEVMSIEPKTKIFNSLMKKSNLAGKKVLIVTSEIERGNFHLATRNITNVHVVASTNLNAYNVLTNDAVVFVEGAIDSLQKHYSDTNES